MGRRFRQERADPLLAAVQNLQVGQKHRQGVLQAPARKEPAMRPARSCRSLEGAPGSPLSLSSGRPGSGQKWKLWSLRHTPRDVLGSGGVCPRSVCTFQHFREKWSWTGAPIAQNAWCPQGFGARAGGGVKGVKGGRWTNGQMQTQSRSGRPHHGVWHQAGPHSAAWRGAWPPGRAPLRAFSVDGSERNG